MVVYELGERLVESEVDSVINREKDAVFIVKSEEARYALEITKMGYEGEIDLESIALCKLENQQECLWGTLNIPRLLDVLGARYRIMFFADERYIVIVDDSGFSLRLVKRIQQRKSKQGSTREKFLANYMGEFLKRDLDHLLSYERQLMDIEENITDTKTNELPNDLLTLRKELLMLRSYYDEIMDLSKEFEENENEIFDEDELIYFGNISDRADRLMSKTSHLLEYSQQIRDTHKSIIDAQQNSNMQFLTIISTVFFPLTLVTGWYGMNFQNMPELQNGYPAVIGLSIVIIIVVLLIFKKKKII